MVKRALGKGLAALLPELSTTEELLELDLSLLEANQSQPRSRFDEKKIQELAESIKENGLVQPIVVRKIDDGRYQIVAGERRWRAAKLAGLQKIPAVVRTVPDDKLLELALVENIAREELNPIEEALAYQRLIEQHKLTQEQVACKVGKDRSSVANSLRLLKLPTEIHSLIVDGLVSTGHAKVLLSISDKTIQLSLAHRIASEGLSVRDVERLVERLRKPKKEYEEIIDPNVRAAEQRLQKYLGTKVRILRSGKGGKIQIDFHTEEELIRIYDLLIANNRSSNKV
ncbi:MAG: ParB/RepB/Spo0J family partition protein [Acidobacteriota bacterium]|nr:ParB/RepB/Spo0J family partition protein [Blastocatellia bacterium]MDW8412449.1 ParB/RepB/Spo0J family partition protein [Acidobacteriota bacterium]